MGSYLYYKKEEPNQKAMTITELKICLQLIQIKLKQRLQKQESSIKKQIEKICTKLNDSKQDLALMLTETLILEEVKANCLGILDPIIELLVSNHKVIFESQEISQYPTINSSIQTLIFYSKISDPLDELNSFIEFCKTRLGQDYISKALANSEQLVNLRIAMAAEKNSPVNVNEASERLRLIANTNSIPFNVIKINRTTIMDDCQMPNYQMNDNLSLSEIQANHNVSEISDFFPGPEDNLQPHK